MFKNIRNVLLKKENKVVIIIIIIFFLYFIIADSIDIVIPLFFSEKRINIVFYGVLLSVTKIIRSIIIIPISMQTVKNKMCLLKWNIIMDMLVLVLLSNTNSEIFIFIGFSILIITTSVINVILNPILGIKTDKNYIGTIFGIRDMFLYLGCFLGLVIVGKIKSISEKINIIWIFYFCIYVLIFLIIVKLDKEINRSNKINEILDFENEKKKESKKKKFKTIISKELLYYLSIVFILGISGACSNYVPLIALEIGIKENSIFYLFSSSTCITAILAIAGGITIDKFNKKKLFQIDIIFFIVILLLYCSTHPTVFIIAIIISGLSSALNNVGNSYIFTNYLEDEINCFWGVIGSISLVSFSIGSIICGILYQINYRYVFIFSIVLNILGLLMSIGMKDIEKGDKNSK